MTFTEFSQKIASTPGAVILMEGRRAISPQHAEIARKVGQLLASSFPYLRFRSGNAEGTDQAFSEGVASIDPSRLQIIAPYSTHRKKIRYEDAIYDSPDTLPTSQEEEIAYLTSLASPKIKTLIDKRNNKGTFAAKAKYLIRDTMKVIGHSEDFPKPAFALFYIDPEDPLAGGTGHTIRVCKQQNVPFAFQDSWFLWV